MTTQTRSAVDSIDKTSWVFRPVLLLKPLVFLLCLAPLVLMVTALLTDRLGANPIESLSHETGQWALRLLLIGLLATPLQQQFRWLWTVRIRRMIGLFAFFYASLHMLVFIWLDQQWDWPLIAGEILEKPYLLAGVLGLLLLLPLALTSSNSMMRKLGRRWKSLHRWVYIAVLAGCVHFVWLAKGDKPEPLVYLSIFLGLLIWRFARLVKK
ncbi:MAG: sulfoxide reductase heme-binding subunit YedZ [Gammaproteobacteria bacterium]|nr:sulfoxide reductase heme-binding subunit YedZ [Gammaproteobacteria bacterium]